MKMQKPDKPTAVARFAPLSLAAIVAAGVALAPQVGAAQNKADYVALAPGSTANTVDKPPESTPIPAYYQDSWKEYLRLKAAAKGGRKFTRADYAKMPDWSGVWTRGPGGLKFDPAQPNGPNGRGLGPTTASLTPAFNAAFQEKLRQVAMGNEWDQLSDCLPAGFPRILTEPFLREFIVTPQETWLINEQQSEARRVYTDDRGHVPAADAHILWDGDSVGFWDGDTLVVHTIRSQHGQYQRSQPDYSQQVSTIEKWRKVGPDTITDDVTVWDPKGLTKPWHVIETYVRVKVVGSRIDMWSCDANNNVIRTKEGASQFILPGETITVQRAYKDPDTFFLTDAQKKIFTDEEGE